VDIWFSSGRIVDLIVALTVAEGAVLLAWRHRTGRGIAPAALIGNLLSGVLLLMALRAALSGAAWRWIAACLIGAFFAHLVDLALRWRMTAEEGWPGLSR
jgi:hypothetical protein